MKFNARELGARLARGLAPVYLVTGDEPLLVAEAAAEIRACARAAGFDQRDLYVVERGFKWQDVEASADTLSLFASRRVLELRLASPRPGDAGGKALERLAMSDDPDRLTLVVTSKLDASAARSRWVKAIDKAGAVVQVWPVDRAHLPAWIERRAAALGLTLTRGATELLADRIEGHLLAADQELRKLALLEPGSRIDEAKVLEAVESNARFDVFRLVDALLAGDAKRAFGVLDGLVAEGIDPVLVGWSLSRELTLLAKLHAAARRGQRLDDRALLGLGVWQRRQRLVRGALKRYSEQRVAGLLREAVAVDRIIKGNQPGDAWQAITALLLSALKPIETRREVA